MAMTGTDASILFTDRLQQLPVLATACKCTAAVTAEMQWSFLSYFCFLQSVHTDVKVYY